MTAKQFKESTIITNIEGVHTDHDIIAFLEHEQPIRDPLSGLQYKFFFV